MKHFISYLLIALLAAATHTAAFQLGAWIAKPSVSVAIAEAAVGANSPGLVRPIAIALDAAARFVREVPRQALVQCQSDLSKLAQSVNQCAARVGRLADQRALIALELAAINAKQKTDQEQKIYVRYQLDAGGACADWADQPICPELLRVRQQEQINRSGAYPLGADSSSADSRDPAASAVQDSPH